MKILTAAAFALFVVAQLPDADTVRDRLDKYLLEYEPQLSTLVADERMTQRDGPSRLANRQTAEPTKDREIISEVAFVALPGNVGWLGFRHVLTVNTKKVSEAGPALASVLSDGAGDMYSKARTLLNEGAKHNLGGARTTNLPNLPLEFLHPRNRKRLRHRIDGMEKVRGINAVRMVFDEQLSPTLIQRPEGGDMHSLISAWVEPDSGRLLRAQVKTRDARIGVLPFDQVIWVDFRPDETLGMLVPVEMKEEFFAGRFREGTGIAKYSNYRQFRTSARIIPQP
jgi:hypothetical protein